MQGSPRMSRFSLSAPPYFHLCVQFFVLTCKFFLYSCVFAVAHSFHSDACVYKWVRTRYTCDCSLSPNTIEPNCDFVSTSASSSSDQQISLITYAVVGGLVAVLLLTILVARIQVYRARHKPVDMTALQDEIRESLGMKTTIDE